jgi:type I restriction enzyme S subunit
LLIAGNGNIGDVKYYKGKFNAYQRTYIIDNFKLDSFYIFYYMDMFFRRTVHEKEQKGAMPYIKKGFLETFKIKIPNNQVEQKSISDILSKADKSIELLEKEIELLREEKKGLMQLLLTGKVRVNEINEEILNEVN